MRGWVLVVVLVVVLLGRHAEGEHTGDLVCRLSPGTRGKLCDIKNLLEKVEGSGAIEIWNITQGGYQEVLMNKKHMDQSVAEIRRLLEENKTNKRYERGRAENLINTVVEAQQYDDREYEEANQTMRQLEVGSGKFP